MPGEVTVRTRQYSPGNTRQAILANQATPLLSSRMSKLLVKKSEQLMRGIIEREQKIAECQREIVEMKREHAALFSTASTLAADGDAPEPAGIADTSWWSRPSTKERIKGHVLGSPKPVDAASIAKALSIDPIETVQSTLSRLTKAGEIVKVGRGWYWKKQEGDASMPE